MKDIEALLPRVFERAPACPEPTAIRYLRDACIEFCRRTRIWRATDTFALTGQACEGLAPYQDTQIFEISAAFYLEPGAEDGDDGLRLDPAQMDWLDREHPRWRSEQGNPRFITQANPNTVRITPFSEGSLRLELILLPSIDALQIPDVLVDTYQAELADGALAKVLALPNEAFGNIQLAAVHKQDWMNSLDRYAASIPKGQQKARRPTKIQGF